MTEPDQLWRIKAWVADRADRDSIVMDREEVEWLISEVERLRAEHLSHVLSNVYTSEGVDLWLDSPNRNLGGERPRDLLRLGWHDEVLQEAERLSG